MTHSETYAEKVEILDSVKDDADDINVGQDFAAAAEAEMAISVSTTETSETTEGTETNEATESNETSESNEATESNEITKTSEASSVTPTVVRKYNYNPDQWSPLNKSGKKSYDVGLLKEIKDDPQSKNNPDVPLLDICNLVRTSPMPETHTFSLISRPINDSLFPTFAKSYSVGGSRSNPSRDPKRDGRNITPSGKGSNRIPPSPGGGSQHKPVIHLSLSRREEIKLNEVNNPWKPRQKKDDMDDEEFKTQELYKKFRGILNKLTPQKFDTLLEKVKSLDIDNQKRLEGVIDLVFEKAIEEPNFSEAYAVMCSKLSMLKVPADNATKPNQCVNFRALIISKCQKQFMTAKVDEQVDKLEKELAECNDADKKKELHVLLEEESRRVRMRSVGNVRFIGELYKLKMLTSKIMVYCMNYLIEKLEEEKLECLCKLLTTIGEQVESEVKEPLDHVFKKMQDIVELKSHITSRIRFMIQDVIELRRRKWVGKGVVDSQPKTMDQIQKEAEQQQRNIELMNASPMGGGFRRDDGGRGKRGDVRRQNSNSFADNNRNEWKASRPATYTVDTSKLKAVTGKNLSNIKLGPPQMSGWNYGSGTKNTQPQAGSTSMISLAKTNMFSVLENVQVDPITLRGDKDIPPIQPSYHSKSASIERSTFNSRADFSSGRSGSGINSTPPVARSTSAAPPAPVPVPVVPASTVMPELTLIPQEPLPEAKRKSVKSTIELCLINPDDDELISEVKDLFPPQYHAGVVTEILNVTLEKTAKEVGMIAKSLLHLVSTNTIASDNFVAGLKEILEYAADLYIDIPMLYEYLGTFIAPHLEKKHITFLQIFKLCENIISVNQGLLILRAIIRNLRDSMGPSFAKCKWQESGLQLKDWMSSDQVAKWIADNKFEFLEGNTATAKETLKKLTPPETRNKLIQLMNSNESCECIRGWIQDNIGQESNEDWFMRSLIQAMCQNALFGAEDRNAPHFNQDRMNKYSRLINEFGDQKAREASCLVGIQQLIHKLEHPQGITLEIFQYLHEQYIISPEGFIAWEKSELEPEGRGVMMKALTSFFMNIKEAENEADNEDSGSED